MADGPAAAGLADREYASSGPAGVNDTSSGPVDTGSAVSVSPAADDDTVARPDLPGADTAVPITYQGELQNTAKYARAGAARIELGVTAGSLCFTVTDDGAG